MFATANPIRSTAEPMETFLDIIQHAGPTVAITAIFVWQSVLRENRMAKRLDKVEDYIRNEYADIVRENTQAMNLLTAAVNRR